MAAGRGNGLEEVRVRGGGVVGGVDVEDIEACRGRGGGGDDGGDDFGLGEGCVGYCCDAGGGGFGD